MAKYRNVSGEVLYVPALGNLRVEPGDIASFPDDYPFYVQTGETGEPPLWELHTPSRKSAKAEKE